MTHASSPLILRPSTAPVGREAPDRRPAGTLRTSGLGQALGRRKVAVIVACATTLLGIAYFFFFDPLFRHSNTWTDPIDLWGIFRGAHYVGWGYLGGVYNQETGMVTFPGIALVLAPVALLADSLHLSSAIGGFILPHPTAALLLVPTIMVMASTVVIAADALAAELGATLRRRALLSVLVGAMAFGAAIIWGHPEDAIVMTFACYGMVSVLRSKWRQAAWLFGIGIAFQPLLALAIPVFLAASPRGQRVLFAFRCSVLAAFLVGIAFIGNPRGAYRALVEQPTPPFFNHATPWVSWAPHIVLPGSGGPFGTGLRRLPGSQKYMTVTAFRHALLQVAAGPGRTIYLVLAVLVGLYVWRRPQDPARLLWLAGVVLGARCYFEAVMTPYYLTPPLILLLVLAAHRGTWRFGVSALVAAGTSWFTYWHLAPWVWWPPVVAGMTVVMVLSYPTVALAGPRDSAPSETVDAGDLDGDVDAEPAGSQPVDLLPA